MFIDSGLPDNGFARRRADSLVLQMVFPRLASSSRRRARPTDAPPRDRKSWTQIRAAVATAIVTRSSAEMDAKDRWSWRQLSVAKVAVAIEAHFTSDAPVGERLAPPPPAADGVKWPQWAAGVLMPTWAFFGMKQVLVQVKKPRYWLKEPFVYEPCTGAVYGNSSPPMIGPQAHYVNTMHWTEERSASHEKLRRSSRKFDSKRVC